MKKHALDQKQDVVISQQEKTQNGYYLGLIMMEQGEEDPCNSLNAFMIAEGLARLHSKNEDVPEDIEGWEEFETEARENELGIWENGAPENFEDEY